MNIVKKIALCIISLSLTGSFLSAAPANSPSYDKALTLYKEGRYADAYRLFYSIYLKNLSDEDINYYLGRSAFELQKYEEALAAYDRLLINDPENLRVRLEFARTCYEMGNYTYAKEEFKKVLNSNPPENVKNNIKKYLKAIAYKSNKKRSSFKGFVLLGLGYDSNLYNSPQESSFFIPALNTNISNSTIDDGDGYHQEVVMLNHKYALNKNGSLNIQNNFLAMNKTLFKYSDKNIFYLMYSPSIIYKKKRAFYNIPIILDKMWYGSDRYLKSIAINPSYGFTLNSNTKFILSFKFQRKFYEQSKNKNSDSNVGTLNIIGLWKNIKGIDLKTRLSLTSERKIRGALSNIDKNGADLKFVFSKKLSSKLGLSANISYGIDKYRDIDPLFLDKREDKDFIVGAGATYKLKGGYILKADINYHKKESNHNPYDYDKYGIGLNLIKPF